MRLALLFAVLCAAQPVHPTGVLRDASGAPIAGAGLQLMNARLVPIARATTDARGEFAFPPVAPGDYVLLVRRSGMPERRLPVRIGAESSLARLDVVVDPPAVRQSVTVTALPGAVAEVEASPAAVSIIDRREIGERAKTVVAQVAAEEAGVALQRTSPTIAGVFVRGLTGNKVNVFVDSVRYSNAAARGGINTFLNLVDPSSVDTVEIVRGPNSAAYGSDALGGSVQFLSPPPVLTDRPTLRHESSGTFGSADMGLASSLRTLYTGSRAGASAQLAGRRASRLRPGGGLDSHSALTRFLGLRSAPGRLPDTAFTQYGGTARLYWIPGRDAQIVAHYQRAQQDGGKRVDQLLGGDGNLVADLRNLMLDFAYLRYQRGKTGWLDSLTATGSHNSQREERVNQGGDPRASIHHEGERTTARGFQLTADKQTRERLRLSMGGEYYRDRVRAPSFAGRRPRVPDGALYQSGGAYLQTIGETWRGSLRLAGNLRYSLADYRSRAQADLWPNDSMRSHSVTARVGAVAAAAPGLHLIAAVSQGFRAPHITDLGTLGLTGSGFEVAAPDLAGFGVAVAQVKPETSLNYEAGARYRTQGIDAELSFFWNDLADAIAKQPLILPPGAVGRVLGGEPIIAQNPDGSVFVSAHPSPVLVRTNFGDARIRGAEGRLRVQPWRHWDATLAFTYVHASDKQTGLPPDIEGGTPAPNGYVKLRYTPGARRFWTEVSLHAASRQSRLSSLDLQDRRTGAMRTRNSIAQFFRNGAAARGLVRDGVLLATGETLSQVQDRVLGPGVSAAPLFPAVPGYAVMSVRAGWQVKERHSVFVELENLGDRNYRGISWGLDAPGRGVFVRYAWSY